jgi:Lysylphosphatidylglycerol synthase TM region
VFKKNLPFLKIIIGVLGIGIIYFQLRNKFSLHDFGLIKLKLTETKSQLFLLLCIVMMPLNWLSESIKWHYLVTKISPYTFKQSLKATIAGVYFGNFLPYRLGDLGGRLVYLEAKNVLQGFMLYTVGGISLVYVTLLSGLIPLLNRMHVFQSYLSGSAITLISLSLVLLFPIVIKILPRLFQLIKKIKWLRHISSPELFELSNASLIIVILLSLIRYSIYLSQFVLLCLVFGVHYPILDLYTKSALMFLLFAFVPSFFATEWLTRISIALLVFGNDYAFAITIAASMLWLINILLPSLLGYGIILTYQLKPVNMPQK